MAIGGIEQWAGLHGLLVFAVQGCYDGASVLVGTDDEVDASSRDDAEFEASSDGALEDLATAEPTDVAYLEIYVRDTSGYETLEVDPELVGESCGVGPGYYKGCRLRISADWYSTLCDEEHRVCVPPIADCHDGWCYIPPRSYLSGAAADSIGDSIDAAISIVPRGFYIQETELTEGDFAYLMGYRSPHRSACGDACPVTGITVFEAMEFANRRSDDAALSRCYLLADCDWDTYFDPSGDPFDVWACAEATFLGPECTGYRLPSRAEWELAARGGSPYCRPRGPQDLEHRADGCDTDDIEAVHRSIYCGNADGGYRPCLLLADFDVNGFEGDEDLECMGPVPVRSTVPNDFGLYEVLGNVAEYTQTTFSEVNCNISRPCNTSASFELAAGPEFADVIDPSSVVHVMGNSFSATRYAACASSTRGVDVSWFVAAAQINGFRLARTAIDR